MKGFEVSSEKRAEIKAEKEQSHIGDRLRLLISELTPEKRRFPTLQELTGITESTWRTWWTRGGVPSGSLIEGASRAWPEYAFWLATGAEDFRFGHHAPAGTGFPTKVEANSNAQAAYFRTLIHSSRELNEVADSIWREDIGMTMSELFGDSPVTALEIQDETMRNAHQMTLTGDPRNEYVRGLRRTLSRHQKLREIEILLDIYIPQFDPDATGAILKKVAQELFRLEENAIKEESPLPLDAIRRKFERAMLEHQKWLEYKDSPSHKMLKMYAKRHDDKTD